MFTFCGLNPHAEKNLLVRHSRIDKHKSVLCTGRLFARSKPDGPAMRVEGMKECPPYHTGWRLAAFVRP